MSDSKSQDHWKALALLLDVSVPPEPEPPEEQTGEDSGETVGDSPSPAARLEDGDDRTSSDELSSLQEADTVEVTEAPALPKQRERSRPRPKSAAVDATHWAGLAGELGIEVPEEEPELAADEPELEAEPVDEGADEDQSPSAILSESQAVVGERDIEVEAVVEAVVVESDEHSDDDPGSDVSDDVSQATSDVASRKPPSLFEDESFSLDAPGALDRIFDEAWDDDAASPSPAVAERREEVPDFGEDEDEEADEEPSEEDEDDAEFKLLDSDEGPADADAPAAEAEGGDEPRRRRRRRRRRKRTAGDGVTRQAGETAEDESSDGDQESVRVSTGVAEESDAAQDLDDEQHDEMSDDEDDDLSVASVKHRKIPTWSEAIALVISNNMESRARNPGNGNRGRGRGRGRRS